MKRRALGFVAASTMVLALAYGLGFLPDGGGRLSPLLLALGTAGVLCGTLALAVGRDRGLGVLWIPVAFVGVVVGGGLAALLFLPAADPDNPRLLLGLPLRAALLLYGVGLLPTLVVPVTYALTFDRLTLRPGDLERVREAGRKRREGP